MKKTILAFVAFLIAGNIGPQTANAETFNYSGGCFWCTESDSEKLEGVSEVISGFTGGTTAITALNQELYADFAGLRVARLAEDALIINYIESLNDDSMLSWLEYRNMAGEDQADEISILLSHFFNHQTHHRGQVHTLLSHAGLEPPQLDLIYYLREQQ